jgi:Tfp pilus assembly protein PilO
MRSNPRFYYLTGTVGLILIALLGWMLGVKPVFSAVEQTNAETVATEKQTETVIFQTRQLAEQQKDLEEQIDALMRIRAKIPKDVNVPKLMRTIQAEARMEGVELDSLQPGQITLFLVEPEPTPSDSSSPQAGTDSAAGSKPQPAPTPSNLGQGLAPKNTGVAYVPLTLSGQGTYAAIRRLTARLEQQQRAFLITMTDVVRQEDADADAPLEFTMTARVFVLNGDEVQLPADLRPGGE